MEKRHLLDITFWQNRAAWPSAGKSLVFVCEALDLAGSAMWGSDWTGDEWRAEWPMPPLLDPSQMQRPAGVSDEVWLPSLARARRNYEEQEPLRRQNAERLSRITDAANWLAEKGMDDKLETYARQQSGPDLQPHPAERFVWNATPALSAIFYNGGADVPASTYFDKVMTPFHPNGVRSWLFVTRNSLNFCLGSLPHAKVPVVETPAIAEGVHLSPYILVMIEAARRSGIGPSLDEQIPKESLIAEIEAVAAERALVLSGRDAESMASLMREPESRAGLRSAKAKARKDAAQKA